MHYRTTIDTRLQFIQKTNHPQLYVIYSFRNRDKFGLPGKFFQRRIKYGIALYASKSETDSSTVCISNGQEYIVQINQYQNEFLQVSTFWIYEQFIEKIKTKKRIFHKIYNIHFGNIRSQFQLIKLFILLTIDIDLSTTILTIILYVSVIF